jgi:hypothetical protein
MLVPLMLALLVGACSASEVSNSEPRTGPWDHQWQDGKGNLVDERVVSSVQGPEHCDWETAVFLYLGWPLGTRSRSADEARQYVRDPDGLFPGYTAGPFDPDAILPKESRYTGYHLGDVALWVGRDAAEAVYLVRGTDVERWPRAERPIACA